MKSLIAAILFIGTSLAASKEPTIKDHALRYFGSGENVIRVAVVKSWFWQVHEIRHSRGVERSNEIITVFRVVEVYKGDFKKGSEICCFHRHMKKKHLKLGDEYVFETSTPKDQVHFADAGMMIPIDMISKVRR